MAHAASTSVPTADVPPAGDLASGVPAAGVPTAVCLDVQRALGARSLVFRRFVAGANRRTYLVEAGPRRWVVRFQSLPAEELQRTTTAQRLAHAAGVVTPELLAHNLGVPGPSAPGRGQAWGWVLEAYVPGDRFDLGALGRQEARAAVSDLGRQLHRLHTIPLDAFGLVPPRPWRVYPTYGAWLDNQARRVDAALRLAGAALDLLPALRDVYALLRDAYGGEGARLVKSDCHDANILVADGRVAALLDWEWAQGADPAYEVGEWYFHAQAPELLDGLLAGYGPARPAAFRRRVLAYQVLHAVGQIHVFHEYRTRMSASSYASRIASFAQRLTAALVARPWEGPS